MTMLVVYTPFLTGQLNNADGFINGVIAHKKTMTGKILRDVF